MTDSQPGIAGWLSSAGSSQASKPELPGNLLNL